MKNTNPLSIGDFLENTRNRVLHFSLFLAVLVLCALPVYSWYDSSFAYCRDVNITNTGAQETNFTYYVHLNSSTGMKADRSDIRIVGGNCSGENQTAYKFEMSNYTASDIHLYVLIPTFTTGKNQIAVYYGNANASSVAVTAQAWDSGYLQVWHFANNSGLGYRNTKTGNNTKTIYGTPYATTQNTFTESSMYCNGASSVIINESSAYSQFTGGSTNFTISGMFAWNTTGQYTASTDKDMVNTENNYILRINNENPGWSFWMNNGGSWVKAGITHSFGAEFNLISIRRNSTSCYIIENTTATSTSCANPARSTGADMGICGSQAGDANHVIGWIDELYVSNVGRSTNWLDNTLYMLKYQSTMVEISAVKTLCSPVWSCSAYADCNGTIQNCTAVQDSNNCGLEFTGDLETYNQNCTIQPTRTEGIMTMDITTTSGVLLLMVILVLWIGLVVISLVFHNVPFMALTMIVGFFLGFLFLQVHWLMMAAFWFANIMLFISKK